MEPNYDTLVPQNEERVLLQLFVLVDSGGEEATFSHISCFSSRWQPFIVNQFNFHERTNEAKNLVCMHLYVCVCRHLYYMLE